MFGCRNERRLKAIYPSTFHKRDECRIGLAIEDDAVAENFMQRPHSHVLTADTNPFEFFITFPIPFMFTFCFLKFKLCEF